MELTQDLPSGWSSNGGVGVPVLLLARDWLKYAQVRRGASRSHLIVISENRPTTVATDLLECDEIVCQWLVLRYVSIATAQTEKEDLVVTTGSCLLGYKGHRVII